MEELKRVEDITKDNVKIEDKEALEKAKEKLEEMANLDDLKDSEKDKINDELDRIEDALDKIKELEEKTPIPEIPEETIPEPTKEPDLTDTDGVQPTDNASKNENILDDNFNIDKEENTNISNKVSTGDTSNRFMWLVIAVISVAGIGMVYKKYRRIR